MVLLVCIWAGLLACLGEATVLMKLIGVFLTGTLRTGLLNMEK